MTNTCTKGEIDAQVVMAAALSLMEAINNKRSQEKQKIIDGFRGRPLSLWERITGNVSRLRMTDEEIVETFNLWNPDYVDWWCADNYAGKAYKQAEAIYRLCDNVMRHNEIGVKVFVSAEDAYLLRNHL